MILVLDEAADELTIAANWYEAEREGFGGEFIAEAGSALLAIQDTPTAWPRAPGSPSARRFVFKRFPYVAYFVIRDNRILIVAFAHTSRRPGYWVARLKD